MTVTTGLLPTSAFSGYWPFYLVFSVSDTDRVPWLRFRGLHSDLPLSMPKCKSWLWLTSGTVLRYLVLCLWYEYLRYHGYFLCCGSGMCIPDLDLFHPWSRIHGLQGPGSGSASEIWSGMCIPDVGSWIRIFSSSRYLPYHGSWIQWLKKHWIRIFPWVCLKWWGFSWLFAVLDLLHIRLFAGSGLFSALYPDPDPILVQWIGYDNSFAKICSKAKRLPNLFAFVVTTYNINWNLG